MSHNPKKKTVTAALPMELIEKILTGLPVKSLMRFKSVSKSWLALIKDPRFKKLHFHRTKKSKKDIHVLTSGSYNLRMAELNVSISSSSYDLWFSKLDRNLFNTVKGADFNRVSLVIGTCNGIVCITNYSRSFLTLYNPLINTYRDIAFPDMFQQSGRIYYDVGFGFGYDSVTDDYKVLCFIFNNRTNYFQDNALLYSSKNNSWKNINNIIPFSTSKSHIVEADNYFDADPDDYEVGVLVNESLHYLVTDANRDFPKVVFIGIFDLNSESYLVFDLPAAVRWDASDSTRLHALDGSLCVSHEFDKYADVWIMKEYGNNESWTLLFRVNKIDHHPSILQITPLAFSEDRELVLFDVKLSNSVRQCKMHWFNLKTQRIKGVSVHKLSPGKRGCVHVFEGTMECLSFWTLVIAKVVAILANLIV